MTNPEPRPVSLAEVGRSTFILAGSAAMIQIIGFARQLFLAAEVGITSGLDALLIALAAPFALVAILTAGVQIALVPAYLEAKDGLGMSDARRLAGVVLFWTGVMGAAIATVLWVFAEPIIVLTGPGLVEAGTAEDAVRYLRSLAALGFLLPLSSIMYALCQAESLFSWIAVAQVAGPLITLAILLAAWDTMGLDGLVIGTLVGAVASLSIVALATVLRRVSPTPSLSPRGLGLGSLARHAAPLSASAAILEMSSVFDRAIASWLAAGGVSALRYGESIVRLPFAAISPAWGQAVYPALVRARNFPGEAGLASMTERIVRYAIAFFVPLAGLTVAVAPVAVATAYGRGSFTSDDVMLTAQVVAVSAPLIVMWTVAPTLVAALNARRMGTVMFIAGVINVVLNLLLNVLLGYLFGIVGVALATTLATAVVVIYFGHRLGQVEPTFSHGSLYYVLVRALVAILPSALIFGIPIWGGLIQGGLLEHVVVLVIVGVAGLWSYYLIARLIGLDEVSKIVGFGRSSLVHLVARLRAS